MKFNKRVLMTALSILALLVYIRMVVWRPDLAGVVPDMMMGQLYLPWWNVLGIAVVGIVLLLVTRNIVFSLLVGGFATLVWTPIDLRFWGLIVDSYNTRGTYLTWWIGALGLLILAIYHGQFVEKKGVCKKIIVPAFGVYVGMFILIYFFHDFMAPNWIAMLRLPAGEYYGYTPSLIEITDCIIQKISGYLFYSLGITYIIARKRPRP